jgi:hypothetical protein
MMRPVSATMNALRKSPAEWWTRGRQQLSARFERFSPSPNVHETSDEAFAAALATGVAADRAMLSHALRDDRRPDFFAAFDDPPAVAALVRSRFPDAARQVIARAERAVADRFDVLGHAGLSYGSPIDWNADPLAARRAPMVHWSRVPYLNADVVGDHKVVWELNRHQHLVTLGQAYWLTGDERFASSICRHLVEWIDANPPKLGINWSSSLEVAFRAISWCWAMRMVHASQALTAELSVRVLKHLNIHAHHIAAHLSTYFSPNTHLTGEALGLLHVGTLFPELRAATQWRELGWAILEDQLPRHIRSDGVYFEQTTWYQRYTVDFYLHALLLRERSGHAVSPNTRARIELAIEPLIHFMRPDGRTSLIGDDDGGRLAPHHPEQPNDFRSTIALAAVVFGRPDCAALAGDAVAALPWIAGVEGMARFDRLVPHPPRDTARLFEGGGYVVSRTDWSDDADYILIDCGGRGSTTGGHAHADALAFELTIGGRALLVDPGTFSYIEPARDAFRATAAHNAVTVDGRPSSEPGAAFRWEFEANGGLDEWCAAPGFAFFRGHHDGFRRLADPVSYERSILIVHGFLYVIRDRVGARGAHEMTAHFHGDAGLEFERTADGCGVRVVDRSDEAPKLELMAVGTDLRIECSVGEVSPAYGVSRPAPVCSVTVTEMGNQELITFLLPAHRGAVPSLVERTTQRGRLFSIAHGRTEQIIGVGTDGIIGDGIRTDASWLWARRDVDSGAIHEYLVLGATSLELDGRQYVVRAGCRTPVSSTRGEASRGERDEPCEQSPQLTGDV